MAKVLRITRHPMVQGQRAELEHIYGSDLEVIEVAEQVDAARVKQLAEERGADVVEATLPMAIVAELTKPKGGLGVPLIRAVTEREEKEGQPTIFHFKKYVLLKKVEIVTEDL